MTIWFLNQFFVVIILLNFLIAVISQSYENVMNKQDIKKYEYIADLNEEALMMINSLPRMKRTFDGEKQQLVKKNQLIVSIKTKEDQEDTEEWVGFIQTIKLFMKKSFAS